MQGWSCAGNDRRPQPPLEEELLVGEELTARGTGADSPVGLPARVALAMHCHYSALSQSPRVTASIQRDTSNQEHI
jgi:hypothetical protein